MKSDMVIQKLLIQYVLMPLAKMMEKLSERAKERLFVAAGLGVGFQIMWQNTNLPMYRYLVFFAIGCVFLGIMILCTLNTNMKPVRFRWSIMACWLGVGIMILQSALRLNLDYATEALIFLVAFPVLFICWNNADRTKILKLLLRIMKIVVVTFMIACFLFAKITTERYQGIFNNPNGMAELLMLAVGCQLVEILYAKRLDWRCWCDILILGCSVALCYYTNSRTGYLGMICAALFGIGMYALTHNWKENGKCLVRLMAAALITVICVFNLVYVFQWRAQIELPSLNLQGGAAYASSGLAHSSDTVENERDSEIVMMNHAKLASSGIAGFQDVAEKKGETENKSLDDISTGRITIWKFYASDLNLFGHATMPPVYVPLTGQTIGTSHMNILQFAYESGLLAGVFYFLVNLASGVLAIWFAWKYRNEKYAVMPLVVTVVFGVGSLLSASTLSLGYLITFYYYCVLFPIMVHQPVNVEIKE